MVHDQEFKDRLVVPKSKRSMLLKLAHEFSGHVGCKRMKVLSLHGQTLQKTVNYM